MSWTVSLRDDATADRARAGGKAVGLATLARAGLPVPDGFVVLASAMDALLGPGESAGPWSDAAVRAEAARRAALLRTAPLPAGFEEEVRRALAALGDAPVAVRSSGVEEDARERSAAGQFETFADVRGPDAVLAAIRACWASVHSHRAAVYRSRTGRPPFGARAAVIVQRMADADVSGVVFTRDPLWRRSRHLVVEAAPGAGGVVGGGAVERWEVPREDAAGGAVAGGGRVALLDEAALRELARAALRAEAALGGPADVEFAWSKRAGFALLQLRPVTSPRPVRSRRRAIVWTQRFSGERWIEPATPLGWSIVEPALARYTQWDWASRRYLHGTRIARLVTGIPFFNVTIFRHLLVKTPWTPTPEFVLELFPPEEAAELRHRRWILPSPGLVALVIAEALLKGRWRGHRWLWFTNPRDWERLAPRLVRTAHAATADLSTAPSSPWPVGTSPNLPPPIGRGQGVGPVPPTPDSLPGSAALQPDAPHTTDLLARLDELRAALDRYVGVHLWSLLWANLFYQVLGVLLERWGGSELHALRPALVVGGPDENLTMRANAALAGLAARASADERLARLLLDAPDGRTALAALSRDDSSAARSLREGLADVLRRYGHRARSTWEPFSPRWRDEPELLVEMIRSRMRAAPAAAAREDELRASRDAAEALLAARLPRLRLRLVRGLLARTRTFSHLRENQRMVLDEMMLAVRDVSLALGARLAGQRRLVSAEDVTLLPVDDVRALAEGRLSAAEAARRIASARAALAAAREAAPPAFLFEHGEGRDAARPGGTVLVGLGISPGRVRGRVRVARTLEEASRLQPGEVLVAKATDPGWTPYFPVAAGLVTELGGLLSHAAVVAREYGLPAVANVPGATRLLRDGEEVLLDGSDGLVYIAPHTSRLPP